MVSDMGSEGGRMKTVETYLHHSGVVGEVGRLKPKSLFVAPEVRTKMRSEVEKRDAELALLIRREIVAPMPPLRDLTAFGVDIMEDATLPVGTIELRDKKGIVLVRIDGIAPREQGRK